VNSLKVDISYRAGTLPGGKKRQTTGRRLLKLVLPRSLFASIRQADCTVLQNSEIGHVLGNRQLSADGRC
jgi:hypothetical protein